MAKVLLDVKYIASIYPGELPELALNHGQSQKGGSRRTVYRLTPVPRLTMRTKPFVLEVSDGFEDVLNLMGIQSGQKYMPKPVDSKETVENLLKFWGGNMVGVPPGSGPGIIEIANTFPTKAELDRMVEMQTVYGEFLFQEGERLNRENNWKEITGAMKVMATWLGKDTIWSNPTRVSEQVSCPACGGMIMPKVSICVHCGTKLRALPKELAALNGQNPMPIVAEEVTA